MAICPNCGRKLKLTDWRPNCPGCGVNLVYYGMEERLTAEADKAEVDHAKIQKKLDRLKASFVGSPLAIIRIFLSLLPLGALMIPICSVSFNGPLIPETTSKINLISLYNMVSSLDFGALITMTGAKSVGTGFIGYAGALISILLSVLMVVVALVALVAACGPKGCIRNIVNNSISIVCAVASIFFFNIFSSNINKAFPDFFTGKIEAGIFVYIAALIILLGLNIYLTKNKINVKYKECLIGGVPYEEYKELIESGVSMDEIHKKMDVILDERERVRNEELARKEAEKKAKEDEELARKAGKL